MDIYIIYYMIIHAEMMQSVKVELVVMLIHQIKLFYLKSGVRRRAGYPIGLYTADNNADWSC